MPACRVLCWMLLLLFVSSQRTSAETPDEKVMARVNGQPITAGQMQLPFFLGQLPASAAGEEKQELINRLIDRELIRQFLKQRNVVADPRLVDHQWSIIKNLIEKKGEDVETVLAKLHLNEKSVRDFLALSIAWQQYARGVVTEKQIREEWAAHRPELDGTRVGLAEIVIQVPAGGSSAEVTARLAKLKQQIVAGEVTFADAARTHSSGASAAAGGELGEFEFQDLRELPLREAAWKLKVGEVSDPIPSPQGLRLISLLSRTAGELNPEDARAQIIRRIADRLWTEQVAKSRKSARIELLADAD